MIDVRINSTTKLSIILALNKAPMHGYALMESVEHSTGVRPGPAQVYPFLSQLTKLGYVSASKKGVRDKTVYSLTAKGKGFTGDVLSKMGTLLEGALKGRITQCSHCACKIFGKPYEKAIGGQKFLFCCPHCAQNFLSEKSPVAGHHH